MAKDHHRTATIFHNYLSPHCPTMSMAKEPP
jgi:hypothetical protein